MTTNLRRCDKCLKDLLPTQFYSKAAQGTSSVRLDKLCKDCRCEEKRNRHAKKYISNAPATSDKMAACTSDQSATNEIQPPASDSSGVHKRYFYPDGRIVELTKEEFDRVVKVFLLGLNENRRRSGRPLLLG